MPSNLQDVKVNLRLKLATLWTSVMFIYLYGDYFALYIPGQAGKLVSGETLLNSPVKVFAASVLMAIPPAVIIVSVFAKSYYAKLLNIIFGIIFSAIMLLIAVTSIPVTPEVSAYVFYAILESVITIAIVRLSWKWPKTDAE